MKGLGGSNQFQAPSYAPSAQNVFDSATSRYNLKSANKYQTRLAIGNARAGLGIWDCAFVGASALLGYNGNGLTQDTSKQWPTVFQNELAQLFGTGGVAVPTAEGPVCLSGQDDRTVLTGNATRAVAPGPAWVVCVGAGTITTTVKGTGIGIQIYSGNTVTPTVTVDGGAPPTPNLVPGGGSAPQYITVAPIGTYANANHVVVITVPAGGTAIIGAIYGITVAGFTGIRFTNLALGGSYAHNPGGTYSSWSNLTSAFLPSQRLAALSGPGIIPQTWFIDLTGSNDAVHGYTPAQMLAGLDAFESQIPLLGNGTSPDIFYILNWNVTPISASQFQPYQDAIYARCDAKGYAAFDWNDAMGGLTKAIQLGAIGPDNIHPTYANQAAFGEATALAFVS